MRQEPDIRPDDSPEEEAERASRDLGEQIENARRVLREYHAGIHGRAFGDDRR